MQFEDKSTQCPNCQKPLIWISHIKRWEKPREIHEFNFNCGSCNRKFQFRDDQLIEKPPERDPAAEISAVHNTQLKNAVNRRCLQCGGPITKGLGLSALNCDWCHQEYSLVDGELLAKPPDLTEPKPKISEFYAVHARR